MQRLWEFITKKHIGYKIPPIYNLTILKIRTFINLIKLI